MRIATLLLLGALACSHQPKLDHLDECPKPWLESMSWRTIEGTISAVEPDGTLVLTPQRRVHLVSVAVDDRSYLKRLIGKKAMVYVNPRHFEDETMTGIVEVRGKDINREMLARGAAHYVRPEAYTVSDYVDCTYRLTSR